MNLYQKFGFYQGDIWYFYTFYGEQIKNEFFYQIEYPIGYILIQKTAYLLSLIFSPDFSYQSFMLGHFLLIIPTAIVCFYFFIKLFELLKIGQNSKIFAFALSPSLAIYSSINYDLFPMTLTLGAIAFLLKEKYFLSFLFLGLGTSIKIYPLFLLPLFVLFMISRKIKITDVVKHSLVFITTFLFINLPFYLYNSKIWIFPYLYQAQNPEKGDPTTISYFLFSTFNLEFLRTPFLLLLIGVALYISFNFFKKKILTNNNVIFLSSLILFSSVFGNQVYTPQYIMWFLPYILIVGIIPLVFFYPFDLVNAATRFFYFKLKNEYQQLFYLIWNFSVIYYLIMYLLLINFAQKKLNEKN